MSRKSKYNPDQHPIICEMFARYGLTIKQMAKEIGVSDSTLRSWIAVHPALKTSLTRGKSLIKAQIENKLLDKALGNERQTEQTIRSEPLLDKSGKPVLDKKGMPIQKQVKTVKSQLMLPDLGAIKMYLHNRYPQDWRERVHVSAQIEVKPVEELTEAELNDELAKFGVKIDQIEDADFEVVADG